MVLLPFLSVIATHARSLSRYARVPRIFDMFRERSSGVSESIGGSYGFAVLGVKF